MYVCVDFYLCFVVFYLWSWKKVNSTWDGKHKQNTDEKVILFVILLVSDMNCIMTYFLIFSLLLFIFLIFIFNLGIIMVLLTRLILTLVGKTSFIVNVWMRATRDIIVGLIQIEQLGVQAMVNHSKYSMLSYKLDEAVIIDTPMLRHINQFQNTLVWSKWVVLSGLILLWYSSWLSFSLDTLINILVGII